MNKYRIKYKFKKDNIVLEDLIIDAEDMVRAVVLAEKRIEIDTRETYEIISIEKSIS